MRCRAGSALFAAMLVIVIGAIGIASLLRTTVTEAKRSVHEVERASSTLAARSAVRLLIADLAAQREAMLACDDPELPTAFPLRIPESDQRADARSGGLVVRLVDPIEAQSDDLFEAPFAGPELPLRPEAASLDLLSSTSEEREALLGDPLDGLDPAATLDTAEAAVRAIDPPEADSADPNTISTDPATLITLFSADPDVAVGVSAGAPVGTPRVRIDASREELIEAIQGDEPSDPPDWFLRWADLSPSSRGGLSGLTSAATAGTTVDIWQGLAERNDPYALGAIIDRLSIADDLYRLGLVDINRAPLRVLNAVGGLSIEDAEALIEARERIDPSLRTSIAWPFEQDVITAETFGRVAERWTTRTLQWRTRVVIEPDTGDSDRQPTSNQSPNPQGLNPEILSGDDAEPIRPLLVLEVIIDLAGPTPRIAMLREVTWRDRARETSVATNPPLIVVSEESILPDLPLGTEAGDEAPPRRSASRLGTDPVRGASLPPRTRPGLGGGDEDRRSNAGRTDESSGSTGDRGSSQEASPKSDTRRGRWRPGG